MTADNALPAGQAKASNLATLIGSAVATAMAALHNELNKRNAALNWSAQRLVDIFQSAQQQQRITGGN